jgi:hypothetical protein
LVVLSGRGAWSSTIPARAFEWLLSYSISLQEIIDNRIQWDEAKQLLIFPVYSPTGDLVMYQGRYFGDNPEYPKYITYGPVVGTYDIHWFPDGLIDDCICIVEDFISAIKVSRVLTSMPMWGSRLSNQQLLQLSSWFKKIIWWVDPDKQKEYPNLVNRSSLFFEDAHCVYSELDPKFYSTEEICKKLI